MSNAGIDRRAFLVASTFGLGVAAAQPARRVPARSTILFFLSGGASHVDTWDMKPGAPLEYRGPFEPIPTAAPGLRLCEHLPMLARQADHLAVVRSVGAKVNTNDHHAGYYYNLTGHVPDPSFLALANDRTPRADDWPFMGSVVASRRPPGALPNAITLPQKPSEAPYTRPGQFAARLGIEHDPLYIEADHPAPLDFRAPALVLDDALKGERLLDRRSLLRAVDDAHRQHDDTAESRRWSTVQRRAWDLLASTATTAAFDVAGESVATRERYGQNVNGMSLLLARRLVESGVPFVTVFWKEDKESAARCKTAGGWDTHGDNFHCLKEYLLPPFDRALSALIEDLNARGLLDSTLLLVTSEMGRTPRIGDPRSGGIYGAGRDHWTHCMSVLMAGGGIRGGQAFGSSDRRGEYPADRPVTPAHITHTVYHAMGVEDLEATDAEGRVFPLLEGGRPLVELF